MPNKTEGCICTSTTGLSMPPLCPQHANASRQELLRQLAEQGGKLKAAEALAPAALLGKSAAEHRVSALCTERDGLKARLATAQSCTDCGGPEHSDKDCMCGGTGNRLVQIKGLVACIQYWRKLHRDEQEKVKALEQRIAGAKVCPHIYTRVALTSTTNCPACTNGIVWPQPAGDPLVSDEVAELRRKIASARVCDCFDVYPPLNRGGMSEMRSHPDCKVCGGSGIAWPQPAEQTATAPGPCLKHCLDGYCPEHDGEAAAPFAEGQEK